jgi:YD repeat-containing protein
MFYAQVACPNANVNRSRTLCNCDSFVYSGVDIGSTDNYKLDSISYAPESFSNGTQILVSQDDIFSGVINIPFNFCFYGNVYQALVIGANGLITFNLSNANKYNDYKTQGYTIPNINLYGNSIFGPYHDMDPSKGGRVNISIIGVAPCRRFVVSWDSIPMYDFLPIVNCQGLIGSQQIILYETTNIIEVHIREKPFCTAWNSGVAHLGMQNANASSWIAAPGKNRTQWALNNTSFRFTPNGASRMQYSWTLDGNIISNNKNVLVCSKNQNSSLVFNVSYRNCDSSTLNLSNTINNLSINNNLYDSFVTKSLNCNQKVRYTIPCTLSSNSDKCIVKNIFGLFTYSGGFGSIPRNINDYTFKKIDSSLSIDCSNNKKEYILFYSNQNKGDIVINISIDCSCSPPTCPPPSKVNPFLYNLAGNWQSNNSYAYNTKRESTIANQTRSGEYYKTYNSIMNYNGNYWDIGNNANWISKETNTIIDFNGQIVESNNPLKIPSSGKFAFNKTLTNHIASNARLEETFFLSNEDNNMFSDAKISRSMAASNIFAVNEIELPLKPNVNSMWPIISYHGFQNIDSVVRSKDEFHTGFNSLKVLPKTTSNAYAYTNYLFCDYNIVDSVYKDLVFCNSEPTNATGLDINKVTFGGISNLSSCTSLIGSQGNGNGIGGKYSDFTKTIVNNNYNRNQKYNLKVDFNLCGDTMDGFCHAYFDWNQDGDFNDNGEVYVLKGSRNKALSASRDIIIPSFAMPGKTRMRISYLVGKNIVGGYNLPNSSDPCNYQMFNSYGEVEDYTINIFDNYELVKNKPTFSINSNDIRINDKSIKKEFSLQKDKEYLLSYWVKDNATSNEIGYIEISNSNSNLAPSYPTRPSNIEGWHKIEKIFKVSDNKYKIIFYPTPNITTATYYDDIRILPLDGTMKGYVYDELSQRLVSELDENNYATFYDYDEEGQLIRVRKETERGIMTIKESRRSFKQ